MLKLQNQNKTEQDYMKNLFMKQVTKFLTLKKT